MTGKITLVTPPDFFENNNQNILFINLNELDQDKASRWLKSKEFNFNLNFYLYSGEDDLRWLLWASACCSYKFIDLDEHTEITQALCGYLLSKQNFYYKTSNEKLATIYSFINSNRVRTIEDFLEKAIQSDKTNG